MTPDDMRAKAKDLFAAAGKRLADANLGASIETQVAVTVDQTAATVMALLADISETMNPDVKAKKAKQILAESIAKNDALRKAAAKGFGKNDWSEFDRLVDDTDDGT